MPTVHIDNVTTCFGPLLVGCCVDILLQGILFVQFVTYFQQYCDDRLLLKLAVAGLVLFTTLKSGQSFAMLWVGLIDTFGDPQLAVATYLYDRTLTINALTVAVLGSYVRIYFCYRLYVISKARWAVALVASTDALSLGFIVAAYLKGYYLHSEDGAMILDFTFHFSIVFAGDLLLTLLTAFFLIRHKKEVLPHAQGRAHGVINALIRMTFETAAPSAICSLINLTVSLVPVYYQLLGGFNEVLPKLYAVSMMWTLNARQELRSLPWGNSSTLSYISFPTRSITNGPILAETIHSDELEFSQLGNGVQTVQTQKDSLFDVWLVDVRSTNSPESQDPDTITTDSEAQ